MLFSGEPTTARHAPPPPSGITLGRKVAEVEVEGLRILETRHPARFRLPHHDHTDASINLVLHGWMREQVRGRDFECGPGTVLVKPAGTGHANQYGPTEVSCVLIQVPTDSDMAEAWRTALDDVRLLHSPIAFRLLRHLIAGGADPGDDGQLALFETIADLLAAITRAPAPLHRGGTPAWIARVRDVLDDSDRHEIRLGAIAREAGVDPVTLCRSFTSAFGCPPSAYLRQRRVGRAAAAIAAGDGSLSSIAWRSGFSDQAHLTHLFRRLTGMTPGQYRAFVSPPPRTH